ncbi:AAA domain-containing protein [Marivita sp. GX14005]|uniref:AAA domain-containing protein n=1 Tax=Marivita sp. GX14005 TaxID=2942276 RepID=UPI00201946C3|nr:AAA domain-containing protein [Marivita sp. GX14005]MCL3880707.1 AAA domain-containing protein [Marivita sp. GX14005]
MVPNFYDVLRYWRSSLADGALGRGRFRQKDRKSFIELTTDTLRNGSLPQNQVRQVFADQKPDAEIVSVKIWPMVTSRMTSHGTTVFNGMPEIVAPVVTEATVDRSGAILPSRNVIARDVLTPLPNDEFSMGSVEDFDRFLSATPLKLDESRAIWPQYLDHCRSMVDAVAPGWPTKGAGYAPAGIGFMEVAGDAAATIAQIIKLYDTLLSHKPSSPLLEKVACPPAKTIALSEETETNFINRLGHSNDQYPLADHQRQVLSYLSTGQLGDVLAVNGPPGTGKTTMLLSAIADAWVRAALEKAEPPIIVAASTNNQAVTNIIDAFGKDFARGEGPFAGRWLPDLNSYGMFLASQKQENEGASKRYQTERFYLELETEDYFERAKAAYVDAGHRAFPEIDTPGVEDIVSRLHELIVHEAAKLSDIDDARVRLAALSEKVRSLLGDNPETALSRFEDDAKRISAEHDKCKAWDVAWTRHQAGESSVLSLFSFLPPVARKRAAKARMALQEVGCTLDFGYDSSVSDIESALRADIGNAAERSRSAQAKLEQARSAHADLKAANQAWQEATDQLGAPPPHITDALTFDQLADVTSRFQLFRLASHYWEGRWLLEMEADLEAIVEDNWKTTRSDVEPRWRRRMMLTPCAVSTFASLPGKMKFWRPQGEGYLLGFIDLLIVDEAGQVLPEVAAPSFALAKRALVIGDTQQIEPISSVSSSVDIGNLQGCGLLPDVYSEADLVAVSNRGIRSTDGSAMRLAQEACPYEPYPDLERGLYLFEHRRCYDEIIGFSNTLCYNGALRPLRGNAPDDGERPAMGYLHIDGRAVSFGGSRANATEAATIADWLASNQKSLEDQYGKRLADIVGVVTPFGRQVREIKAACAERGLDSRMTVGTVHSLQGAERPIVIFSPVYSKHSDGQFIDMSPSMLNVTVSRAKDCFLVFGDMDVISAAAKGTPRGILADNLCSAAGRALDYEAQPRADLQAADQPLMTLRDSAEHDRFLLDVLSSDARQLTIVSPWVIASTMKRAGLLDGFRKAVARGAEVDVFADPLLNQKLDGQGRSQLEVTKSVLNDVGVCVHEVRQLHSKIVVADSSLLCIGSYNWLSADRKGQYARHETSIVYRGSHLQNEIEVIMGSLGHREKR